MGHDQSDRRSTPPHRGGDPAASVRRGLAAALGVVRAAWRRRRRRAAVPLTAGLGGTVAVTGAVSGGPLGAGAEYALAADGPTWSGPLGWMRVTTGLRVAAGPDPATGAVRMVLTHTLTTPSGDRLTLLRVVDALPAAAGRLRGAGAWAVIGGTGRFGDAAGSGDGDLDLDLPRARFSGLLAGEIDGTGA